ncbi:hypothetical protein D3C85_1391580 [compost metagenome]
MAWLHLAYATLAMNASGSGFVLFDLHTAEPVATVEVLPGILPTVLITFEIRRRRCGRQRQRLCDL